MQLNRNQQAFLALVKAGLWEQDVQLSQHEQIDFNQVYRLTEEQSVVGLVATGIEHVIDLKVPQVLALQFAGQAIQLELRNKTMNAFIADLIENLRKEDVYAILVKGQGIAQCYERPLWRVSGDVDLLLSESNYDRAKMVLLPLATMVETEYTHFKHQGMTIEGWEVELHGTQHSRLSKRVDDGIDATQREVFYSGKARSWMNGGTQVFLPAPDEDVIFVFTHILHHFFFEGIGLRQICDWCRLLWTYRDKLNHGLLESRIRKMGLMSEWKAFAAFAVKWLGMPVEAMPLFEDDDAHNVNLDKKADKICKFVLEVGNFGHKQRRDYKGMSYLRRKFVSVWGRLRDMLRHFQLFPKDSIVFFGGVLRSGLHAAVRGE